MKGAKRLWGGGHRSITFRITIVFSVVTTAVLLGLGWLIALAVEVHFVEQDMELFHGKTHLASHLLSQARSPADLAGLAMQLDESLVGHHGLALTVVDAKGEVLYATADSPFPPGMLSAEGVSPQPQAWIRDGVPWRGLTSAVPAVSAALPSMRIAVALDISHHEHFMTAFRWQLWWYVSLAAVLVGVFGWVAVRRGLAPLQAIRQGAAGVTANRLDTRLDLRSVPRELMDLAVALNDMLARLQESFERLRDFSSDLAHELRTPITNLMTETQVVLTQARSQDEYRDLLASNMEEFERLARMMSDMLFLAKADNGLIVPSREKVDLAEQVRSLFEYFEALADEKGLHLRLIGHAEVEGDKLMLRRALANLLANAIQHTSEGGDIQVTIAAQAGGGAVLRLHNSGEPVSPEHLPRLFDRFYRADPSRHRSSEGAGLGLAITKSIINSHGGQIAVSSDAAGTCFLLNLPAP